MDDKTLCLGAISMAVADGLFRFGPDLVASIVGSPDKEATIYVYRVWPGGQSPSVEYTETDVAEYILEEAFYSSMGV